VTILVPLRAGWSPIRSILQGPVLLGRLAVDLLRPVPGEGEYVLASWPIDRSGRKMSTGGALFSAEGELHAVTRALWIEVSA